MIYSFTTFPVILKFWMNGYLLSKTVRKRFESDVKSDRGGIGKISGVLGLVQSCLVCSSKKT